MNYFYREVFIMKANCEMSNIKSNCGVNQLKPSYDVEQVYNFCGKTIIQHSMCLLPSLPCTSTIKLSKAEGCIKFIDCNLIIVCGVYNKTICSGCDSISENIPYQVLIEDPRITDLDKNNYFVEYVEVKKLCSKFTCLNCETNKYYKLKESDLVTVRVSYHQCNSISWTQSVKLY